jgi:hypothetical protein
MKFWNEISDWQYLKASFWCLILIVLTVDEKLEEFYVPCGTQFPTLPAIKELRGLPANILLTAEMVRTF